MCKHYSHFNIVVFNNMDNLPPEMLNSGILINNKLSYFLSFVLWNSPNSDVRIWRYRITANIPMHFSCLHSNHMSDHYQSAHLGTLYILSSPILIIGPPHVILLIRKDVDIDIAVYPFGRCTNNTIYPKPYIPTGSFLRLV